MKKLVILFAVLFLAAFILLPGGSHGKYIVSKPVVADGWPLPLPPPPPGSGSFSASSETLAADGWPLPLPPPPSGSYLNNLVA